MSRKSKELGQGIEAIFGGGSTKPPKPEEKASPPKSREVKTTAYVREEYLQRLKALAYWDRKTIKEVLAEALTAYYEYRGDDVETALSAFLERQ